MKVMKLCQAKQCVAILVICMVWQSIWVNRYLAIFAMFSVGPMQNSK